MRKARFWFRVDGVAHQVDVMVEPDDTARGVAQWALTLLDGLAPRYRDTRVKLITGRYLPEAA